MSVNFNSTVPSIPGGNTAVTFQTDGAGNVSAYLASSSTINTVVDLTAQSANVGTTTIVSAPATGRYRLSGYIIVTTVASTGSATSTLPSIVFGWTDPDNSTSQTFTITAALPNGNSLTTYALGSAFISAKTSTNISYATTSYASNTASQMQYSLHIVLEAV
jgi:hypothetical protein